MNCVNSRIIYSASFFILLMILIFISKPSIVFDKEGNIRPFGIGYDKTMFSFGVFTVVMAVMSFYLFCIIDMMFNR